MGLAQQIPNFKSEREEADWWDSHQDFVYRLFKEAAAAGKLRRLRSPEALQRLLKPRPARKKSPATSVSKAVTIRLPVADLHSAQKLAQGKGLRYQTYVKMLLHEALRRERSAGRTSAQR